MIAELKEKKGLLKQKLDESLELFKKKDDAGNLAWEPEVHEKFLALEKEIKDLNGEVGQMERAEAGLAELEQIKSGLDRVNRPGMFPGGYEAQSKEFGGRMPFAGDIITKSIFGHPDAQRVSKLNPVTVKIDADFTAFCRQTKATMTTASGFAPADVRLPDIVGYPVRRPMLADLIPQRNVGPAGARTYMEQTTRTNAAAGVAEGGQKPESTIIYTERENAFGKIATLLPVTDEQLDDVPELQQELPNELMLMLMEEEEREIWYGTGVPELQGFATKSGVLTRDAGTDPAPDAILKAMYDVIITGRANPNGVAINVLSYVAARTLRVSAEGGYLYGSPEGRKDFDFWGLTPLPTDAIPSGKALVGDFARFARLARRTQMRVDIGYQANDFRDNKKTFRAEFREALEILRPSAFVIVSNLPVSS